MIGFMEIEETHRLKRDFHEVHDETGCHKRKRVITSELESTSFAVDRAQEIQSNLDTNFPSFVKSMIRSNVTGGFWLSLPKLFCDMHLPSQDVKITLVDENRVKYYTKYLPCRRGLSAGWKGFSVAHNLEEGDTLVFHLIGICTMKVYIVRVNHFSAADAALTLVHLQAHSKLVNCAEHLNQESRNYLPVRQKVSRPSSSEILRDNFEKGTQNFKKKLEMNPTRDINEDLVLALRGAKLRWGRRKSSRESEKENSLFEVEMQELNEEVARGLYAEVEVLRDYL